MTCGKCVASVGFASLIAVGFVLATAGSAAPLDRGGLIALAVAGSLVASILGR
jgi:hypothetical protein